MELTSVLTDPVIEAPVVTGACINGASPDVVALELEPAAGLGEIGDAGFEREHPRLHAIETPQMNRTTRWRIELVINKSPSASG